MICFLQDCSVLNTNDYLSTLISHCVRPSEFQKSSVFTLLALAVMKLWTGCAFAFADLANTSPVGIPLPLVAFAWSSCILQRSPPWSASFLSQPALLISLTARYALIRVSEAASRHAQTQLCVRAELCAFGNEL